MQREGRADRSIGREKEQTITCDRLREVRRGLVSVEPEDVQRELDAIVDPMV